MSRVWPTGAADGASADTASRPELIAGAFLGKYRLECMLGTGGMGVVWAAHDPDLDRAVALKVLRYENPTVATRQRLLREARAMARLTHPNVLTVYEVDSEGDRDFIAMELVEGTNLARWLATRPARGEIWHAILAAGHGLAAAHRAGLVHRDFKPHNVLRSHDGRVLVTDFGLARGYSDGGAALAIDPATPVPLPGAELTGDAIPSWTGATVVDDPLHFATTELNLAPGHRAAPARHDERAVDVALTRPGALLGTPPYMAPEQFLGAACDPRTDQFAYCVTAWQLFSGERPFRGATINELRRTASGGAANASGKLPAAVRAVRARGLEPDPRKRWPDMNALLAALERARAMPRRRQLTGAGAVVLGLAAVLTVELAREHGPAVSSSSCERSPEAEMASAWSPALRASLMLRFAGNPNLGDWLDELDGFGARWIRDYRSACTSPHGTQIVTKLACLLGERDQVAGFVEQGRMLTPPSAVLEDNPIRVMPRVEACDGESPAVPVALPADPVRRAKILALYAKLSRTSLSREQVLAEMPGLLAEAEAVGWDPILAKAHEVFGDTHNTWRWDLAREQYQKAIQVALRSHDYRAEADLWERRLWSEYHAATEPANPEHVGYLIEQAYVALHHAGDGPVALMLIKYVDAYLQWRADHIDDDMLARLKAARTLALAGRDFAKATEIAAGESRVLADRNRPGDLDAGWQLLVDALRVATANGWSEGKLREIGHFKGVGQQGWFNAASRSNAFLRGDLPAAHAWDDREGAPKPPDGAVALRGRVIDLHGDPVAGATVVAWRGTLEGDATRAYLRVPSFLEIHLRYTGNAPPAYHRAGFDADVATTDASGEFTVRAVPDGGIIAELGDRRSPPRPIGDGAIVLQLEPTRTIEGRVTADDEVLSGIVISAHYQLGPTLAWRCTAPVGRLHDYHLGGLPAGQATLRLDDWIREGVRKVDAGPVRDGAEPRWPVGPALDVIIRGSAPVTRWIYVLRGHPTAKTTADLDRLVDGAADATVMPTFWVGAGNRTAEAMKSYQIGDRHRVTSGNSPGQVTVCVAEAEPTSPATCQTIEIPRTTPQVRDGHGVYPAIPVIFPR